MDGWKTIAGAILTLAIAFGAFFGIEPTPESQLPQWASLVLMSATTIFTIYGRFRAKTPAAPQLQRALGTIDK